MDKKRNFKQEIKDWWTEYKPQIKTGATCLGIGLIVGFVKGVSTMTKVLVVAEELNRPISDDTEDDNSEYDEENIDEPESLESVRLDEENS